MNVELLDGLSPTTPIYRYLRKEYFLEMIEKKVNVLAHVSRWEDPYEAYELRTFIHDADQRGDVNSVNRLFDKMKDLFGQSWTMNGKESDVLWRAYGKRGDMVRIQTTVGKLRNAVYESRDNMAQIMIGKVKYKINGEPLLRSRTQSWDNYESLFVKRKEFSDEKEVRLLIVDEEDQIDNEDVSDGSLLQIKIDPDELIESVLVDPCMDLRTYEQIRCRVLRRCSDIVVDRSKLFEWPGTTTSLTYAQPDTAKDSFWNVLREVYKENGKPLKRKITERNYWIYEAYSGYNFNFVFNRKRANVEIYIDSGDKVKNKELFNWLCQRKPEIESTIGEELNWERLSEKRASRVSLADLSVSIEKRDCWNRVAKWMFEKMERFAWEFKQVIDQYQSIENREVEK